MATARGQVLLAATLGVFVAVGAAGCGHAAGASAGAGRGATTTTVAPVATSKTVTPASILPTVATTPTTVAKGADTAPPAATPATTAAAPPPKLQIGSTGPAVVALQKQLLALGYWEGDPSGYYGATTVQAVYALQKAAGVGRDGVVGPLTAAALARKSVPRPRRTSGYVIEIDLSDDLIMFVTNGRIDWTLNTSTGGGYTYTDQGVRYVADTPQGIFHTYRQVDGMVTDTLGQLWRPKFFAGGFAIHGDGYVPAYPVSHGCARVSNAAIDWIWAGGLDLIGTEVWVY
jgi:peptidoglycan hydrolase-like protein with peptidoglycan-binding domain